MNDEDLVSFAQDVLKYCNKYSVPVQYFIDILEDQKVVPMIRGKSMEYNVLTILNLTINRSSWNIQKLNLNAQTGFGDEDISITHRKTGIIIKIESKSAVRGSVRDGSRAKIIKEPHFKVKCHRSRSNISLASTSNDRYAVDEFDVIITNPVNSLYKGNTIGDSFELIEIDNIKSILYETYNVKNDEALIKRVSQDWRFVIPRDIDENGFLPRTPYVKLLNDENWHTISKLEERLLLIVEEKRISQSKGHR